MGWNLQFGIAMGDIFQGTLPLRLQLLLILCWKWRLSQSGWWHRDKLEVNVAHNILTLLTFVEAIGKVDPLGEEDGPARSSQVLSPVHPENNQTRIVTADQYHMNVFLIYPHKKKETT